MASLDNARDLVESLTQNHSEFVVIILQPGKKQDQAIVWYHFHNEEGKLALGDILKHVNREVLPAPPESNLEEQS